MIKPIHGAICFILFVVAAFFAGVSWQRELGEDQGKEASTAQVQTGTPIERVDPYAGKTAREVLGTFNLENTDFREYRPFPRENQRMTLGEVYFSNISWLPIHDDGTSTFIHRVNFEVDPCSKTVLMCLARLPLRELEEWEPVRRGEWEPLSWEEYENIVTMYHAILIYSTSSREPSIQVGDKTEMLRLGRERFESLRKRYRDESRYPLSMSQCMSPNCYRPISEH